MPPCGSPPSAPLAAALPSPALIPSAARNSCGASFACAWRTCALTPNSLAGYNYIPEVKACYYFISCDNIHPGVHCTYSD